MYYLVFGALSAIVGVGLFLLLLTGTPWPVYVDWLAAWSVATFLLYGLDKLLAKASGPRVPELILHVLSVLGGFLGGWLGMLVFRHKSNWRKHPLFLIVLVVSTIGHGILAWYLFLR